MAFGRIVIITVIDFVIRRIRVNVRKLTADSYEYKNLKNHFILFCFNICIVGGLVL